MRFASLSGSSTSDYAAAGKAAADSAATSFAIQRKTGPNYGDLSKAAMVVDSQKFNASAKASAKVAKAGIKAYSNVTRTGQAVKVFEKKNEIVNKQRKAGGLAAIGKIAGAGFLAATDNTKDRERPKADLRGLYETHQTKRDSLKAQQATELDEYGTHTSLEFKPATRGGTSGKVTSGSSTVTPSDGTGIRSQAFNYLTGTKGLSKNKALGIMANVDRESGWDPSIRSGDDGGPGGLFQWKGSRQTSTVAGLVNSGDWKGQLDYALSEPGEAFSQTYQNTTYESPQQAADAWMTQWERPADTTAGSKKHAGFLGGYSF